MAFTYAINNAGTTLELNHLAGDGKLTVVDSTPFQNATYPTRVTCIRASDGGVTILKVLSLEGNVLTVDGSMEGFGDIDLNLGDKVECFQSAGYINDAYDAITEVQEDIDELNLGTLKIGNEVVDASASKVLITDASGDLAQSSVLLIDPSVTIRKSDSTTGLGTSTAGITLHNPIGYNEGNLGRVSIRFDGQDGGTNTSLYAAIDGVETGAGSSTTVTGDIVFSTKNAVTDTSLTERMRVKNTGTIAFSGMNHTTLGAIPGTNFRIFDRWTNTAATPESGGDWYWAMGGPGNYDGQIQLWEGNTNQRVLRASVYGINIETGKGITLGTSGALYWEQNGATGLYVRSPGWDVNSITRTSFQIGFVEKMNLDNSKLFTVVPVYVGANSSGSDNAQFEVKSSSSIKNIASFYDSTGTARTLIDSKGCLKTPGVSTSLLFKSSNYALTLTDSTILADASAGDFQIDLPSAASVSIGRIYTIKTVNSGNVAIEPDGSETIDGASSVVLSTQWKFVTIQSNGENWFVIGSN